MSSTSLIRSACKSYLPKERVSPLCNTVWTFSEVSKISPSSHKNICNVVVTEWSRALYLWILPAQNTWSFQQVPSVGCAFIFQLSIACTLSKRNFIFKASLSDSNRLGRYSRNSGRLDRMLSKAFWSSLRSPLSSLEPSYLRANQAEKVAWVLRMYWSDPSASSICSASAW